MAKENEAVMKTLGAAIKKNRQMLGLTQKQLADFAQCGVAFIYLVESGKPTVRIDKLLDVLSILGLELKLEMGKGRLTVEETLK